jgi:predicted nucleotidyltransferase component of viral defense system
MSSKLVTNVPASITARIKNWAMANSQSYQHALTRYATERFFARLEVSDFSDRFVLKGGNLFVVWFSGKDYRPTIDTDFLYRGHEMTEEQIASAFVKICTSLPPDDGLEFDADSISVNAIREDAKYGGWRVTLKVYLGTVRIPLQFDIGFGDAVTPEPEMVVYPSMLSEVSPRIMAYPMVTMIAEKCAIMVELGFANSRMKDFFDVWTVLNEFEISDEALKTAIAATFKRRGTRFDGTEPLCFSKEFSSDERKSIQWKAYLRKNGIVADCPSEFKEIAEFIASKLRVLLPH